MPLNAVSRLVEARSIRKMLRILREELIARGVTKSSYHFAPRFGSQVGPSAIIEYWRYPEGWIARYNQPEFRANDPIPDYVMREGKILTWQQCIAAQRLTTAQRQFVKQLIAHGLKDGVSIPLFGANGREAYVSILFDRMVGEEDRNLVREIVIIIDATHRLVIQMLADSEEKQVEFSRRENEVLNWMAKGKSNTDIATILGLSPATIDTFARRIFRKLDVGDRVTAVVRGITNGMIRL